MEVFLKEIEIKDAEIIMSLIEQLGYEATKAETIKRIKNIISNEDHFACTAIVENKIVGWIHAFVSIYLESNPFVEIGGLIVEENFRGLGIGKKLIDEAEKWMISKNIYKLRVRTNVNRKDTHRFYLNHGFSLTKEQKIFDKQLNC
jgi:GNAT superfamily N-acetyltransferase